MNSLWLTIEEQIPGLIAFLANLDILVLLATLFGVFIFFNSIGKDLPAPLFTATFISFFLLQIPTNLISWLVEQSNQPAYLVFIFVFIILTLLITRILFKNEFFEPMAAPDSLKEKALFSIAIVGLWTIILTQVFPQELQELTSSSFQFIFLNNYSTEIWAIVIPISLLVFLKGDV